MLLVELLLELVGHLVVALLRLGQIEADLMHVGKRVVVLVLVHGPVGLGVLLMLALLIPDLDDPLLKHLVLLLVLLVLLFGLFDSGPQLGLDLFL